MRSLAAASLLAVALFAQQPQQQSAPVQADDPSRIVVQVNRVQLLYTVSDRRGRFVTDLTRNDFEVIEDRHPQSILEFSAETNLPLRLGILIDTSNSIRERFRFEQEAAAEFVRSVMRSSQDKAMVVSFDTSAELVTDLVANTEKLETAIRNLHPGGGTSLYDAIFYACRDKLSQDHPKEKFRRAIVILSDGDDNQSRYTRDQALEEALRDDVVIYTISTNTSRTDTEGDKVLRYYAEKTGGRSYFPFQLEDLAQSFENINNELTHQYSLVYRPEPMKTDGLFHAIDLRVKGHKELTVRVRPGYYAPKM